MLKHSIKTLSMGAALALAATAAFAQTTTDSTVNTNQTPAAIGVSPQTANEANQKAVQRSDTGTVVRTDESAAQQARDAANRAQNNTTGTTGTTSGTGTMDNTTTTNGTTMDSAAQRRENRATGRAARADRN